MLLPYLPILIFLILSLFIAAVIVGLSHILGPKRERPEKFIPYECGMDPVGSARIPFSVKFYVIAILYIIFDIDIAFLYPWAVIYKDLKVFGFVEMAVFILILLLGFAYVWRRGGLEWE